MLRRTAPQNQPLPAISRRHLLWLISGLLAAGCTKPWMKEPPNELEMKGKSVRDVLNSEDHPRLIHEVASTVGFTPRVFESFGLVAGLVGTGGDCRPSHQRDYLIKEMRANGVKDPNSIMSSPSTAVVQVRTLAPPGIQRNQRTDAIVKLSSLCEASSLEYGNLLEARLQEIQVLGGAALKGMEKARVKGPIVHIPKGFRDPDGKANTEVDYRVGIILGGARMLDPRILGLHIQDGLAHVMTSNAVSKAINEQYFIFDGSKRRGVATPKDSDFIQIDVPHRYSLDPDHFFNVLLHTSFLERPAERQARLDTVALALRDPTTARRAALQLEALLKEGIPMLRTGLENADREVRFYCAYSLAYLDDPASVPVLESLAAEVPAFRKQAITGLSVIARIEGRYALERMLQHPEPEVRYGAIDALRFREDASQLISTTSLGSVVDLVDIPSDIPLLAISLQERPEIAFFGADAPLPFIDYLEISPRLVVRTDGNELRLRTFMPSQGDMTVNAMPTVRGLVEGIHKAGGTYNDMVQCLDRLNERKLLTVPIAFNPRPSFGRTYFRDTLEADLDAKDFSSEVADERPEIRQAEEDKPKEHAWYDVRRFWNSQDDSSE